MNVHLVYRYSRNPSITTPRVDGVYLLRHTARARASTLRADGVNAFLVRRTLRTNRKVRVDGGVKE